MRQDSPLLTPPYKTPPYTTPLRSTGAEETHPLVLAGLDTGRSIAGGWGGGGIWKLVYGFYRVLQYTWKLRDDLKIDFVFHNK